MTTRVRVFAPATVSNLGPGFDVLGLALQQPGDIVDAELHDEPGVQIVSVTGAGDTLTTDPTRNVVGVAAADVLRRLQDPGRGPTTKSQESDRVLVWAFACGCTSRCRWRAGSGAPLPAASPVRWLSTSSSEILYRGAS